MISEDDTCIRRCRAAECIEAEMYERLNTLREEYRTKMNGASDRAQAMAAIDDMTETSISSTESERYREAFHALNRAIEIASAVTAGHEAA